MIESSLMVKSRRPPAGLRSRLAAAAAIAFVTSSLSAHAAPPAGFLPRGGSPLRLGESAPSVTAQRVAGIDEARLEALQGRVVVLDFWATWCGPCREIMPALDRLSREHHPAGLTVLGIAREADESIRQHLTRQPVSYTVARDSGGTMIRYGIRAIPTLVVIDRRGNVREVFVGVDRRSLTRLDVLVRTLLAEPER